MSFVRPTATRTAATTRTAASGRVAATNRSVVAVPASLVMLGDSITANQGLPEAPTALSWFTTANTTLGGVFAWRRNAGVSGDTTAQMLARLQGDVISYSPAWVCVLGGINDLTGAVPAATTIANLTAIYTQALAAGSRLIVCTVLPCTSLNTAPLHTAVDAVNSFVRTYATTHNPVVLVDWWTAFSDPNTDSGYSPVAGYTSDGKHPSATGAGVMAGAWSTALSPYKPGTVGV